MNTLYSTITASFSSTYFVDTHNLFFTQMRSALGRRMFSSSTAPTTKLFLDGKFVESKTTEWIDLHDPATNQVVTRVPKSTQSEMLAAVESSKAAFKTWSQTSILTRQQVMFRLAQIIRSNMKLLAENITKEQGKTLIDAEGDVLRGLRMYDSNVMNVHNVLKSACCYRGRRAHVQHHEPSNG